MIEVVTVTVNPAWTIRILESIAALHPMLLLMCIFLNKARYHHKARYHRA